jgi:hypothetical protein
MRASKLLPLSCLFLLAAAAACGGISDPSREQVATVTGSLTGGAAAPANARVALVWRDGTTGGYAVGADVPIVNGHFSMNLSVPTNAYFFPYDSNTTTDVTPPVSNPTPQPAPDTTAPGTPTNGGTNGGKVPSGKIGTQDTASGQITEAMTIAVSGFVVYVDSNNNGTLDLAGANATSPDQILGGNKELFLAYLKGGGALDYEKLRDKSGILPQHGFNLAWQQGRWLSLDLVELKLTSSPALPSPVCYGGGTNSGSGGTFEDGTTGNTGSQDPNVPTTRDAGSDDGGSTGYPDPSDPNLTCSADGRSYTYKSTSTCPPPTPPQEIGLCNSTAYNLPGCAEPAMGSALMQGQDAPPGWPCPTAVDGGAADGGSAPDSGPVLDAGAGPG